MDALIDANAILDYIEFHILPGLNRYETWVFCDGKCEKVTSGILEHLVLHSAEAKSIYLKGFNSKFILSVPKKLQARKWFTKSTLIRFLCVIGLPNILGATKSLAREISQLEAARDFHLSLYTKDKELRSKNEMSCYNTSYVVGPSRNAEGSDSSKNELLRAMELRLSALRGELLAAFDQAAGSRYSVEDMIGVQKFSENFGSEDLSGVLVKYMELRQGAQGGASLISKRSSEAEEIGPEATCLTASESSPSELPVEPAASFVKAENAERQSFIESENSSFSSEDDEQPSVERSRALARSFSPRRSSSPMRRIQIGRSGSRRSTAISIKSLNYFPARDKSFMNRDATSDSGDEEPVGSVQKCDSVVKRMSVQDAIHLFESKQQKDQTTDARKGKPSVNAAVGSNKPVLRRWSSGTVEDIASRSLDAHHVSCKKDDSAFTQRQGMTDVLKSETGCSAVVSKDNPNESCCSVVQSDCPEGTCGSESLKDVSTGSTTGKLAASSVWNHEKEAELNELFTKMMESKVPTTAAPANITGEGLQRGDSYDQYREKRDKKFLCSAAAKGTQRNRPVKSAEQVETKKLPLSTVSDSGKKPNTKKVQRQQKIVTEPANPKILSEPAAGAVKKAASRASSLPAAPRKSWPSMPSSPKVTGALPAKGLGVPSPTGGGAVLPTRRKSTTAVIKFNSRVDGSSVKTDNADNKRNSRTTAGKKHQQSVLKVSERKSQARASADKSGSSQGKPGGLYSKATKRSSSVVPLESKPYLRKSSQSASVISSAATSKEASADFQEPLRKSESLLLTSSAELVVTQQEQEPDAEFNTAATESVSDARSPRKLEHDFGEVEVVSVGDDSTCRVAEPEPKIEESTISPQAWVETEEPLVDHSHTCGKHVSGTVDSPANLLDSARESSPRVRHSLSQMLLQETHEHDAEAQWGNAENPQPQPVVVYHHKDAPKKGLKRLLKFGRKSRSDANSNGFYSSPSEGDDDDAEITKFVDKKKNAGKLQRKSNIHQKNSRQQQHPNTSDGQVHKNKFRSQKQLVEGNPASGGGSTKARTFFSLSVFKSSK